MCDGLRRIRVHWSRLHLRTHIIYFCIYIFFLFLCNFIAMFRSLGKYLWGRSYRIQSSTWDDTVWLAGHSSSILIYHTQSTQQWSKSNSSKTSPNNTLQKYESLGCRMTELTQLRVCARLSSTERRVLHLASGPQRREFLFTLSANDHIYGNGGSAQLRIPP